MTQTYKTINQLQQIVPIFPLAGILLLPRAQLPLNIFEPRYLALLNHALGHERVIGIIQPQSETENADKPILQNVGCLGRITSFSETDDNRMLISLTGVCRFRVAEEMDTTTPYRMVRADYGAFQDDLIAESGAVDVNRVSLLHVLRRYLDAHDMSADWEAIEQSSNETLINSLSIISPFGPREKQALLEATSLCERNEILIALTEMALAHSDESDNDNDTPIQ